MKRVAFLRSPLSLACLGTILLLQGGIPHSTAAEPEPPRIKRADGFLGIHFDFHAMETDKGIGKNTTQQMIRSIIDQVHPDYLQIDCKGHPGISSYPTKVGNPAPAIVGDPLKLWRKVTAERGVSLVMHYSGVIDIKAIHDHPDWAALDASGKPVEGRSTSLFGPYVDRLLIPQLKELAGTYGVDGAWIDGSCWGVCPDYSAPALEAFRKATGLSDAPRSVNDPHWFEFMEFNREAFRAYLRHYLTEVKKSYPNFQLASNWAFTDMMPEPVSAPVDFLSGDLNPTDTVNSARISARNLAGQGKPWDLQSWSFIPPNALPPSIKEKKRLQKTAVQMEREAAVILAEGGGYQVYFTQNRDGSVRLSEMSLMAEVAKFCRARQAFCHHAVQVPQVALLLSTAAHYRQSGNNKAFPRDPAPYKDTLQALVEGQQSVELLGEHRLTGRMEAYPLIVVPDWGYLEPKFKEELLAYVQDGGQLLLVGPKPAKLFQTELDIDLAGNPETKTLALSESNKPLGAFKGTAQKVTLGSKTEGIGILQETGVPNAPTQPAASITSFGKGRIAAIYASETVPAFINSIAHRLFPRPMVEVKGSPDVDVVVNHIGGKLAVNLINTSGPHQTQAVIENIAPIGPLYVTIRQQPRPTKVTLQPAGQPLPFQYRDGEILLTLSKLEIHDILLVE